MKKMDVGYGLPVSADGVVDGGFLQPNARYRLTTSLRVLVPESAPRRTR